MTNEMTVTERVDGLRIEDGLIRLLAHWVYGLTKQPASGRIQEVFLVSLEEMLQQIYKDSA